MGIVQRAQQLTNSMPGQEFHGFLKDLAFSGPQNRKFTPAPSAPGSVNSVKACKREQCEQCEQCEIHPKNPPLGMERTFGAPAAPRGQRFAPPREQREQREQRDRQSRIGD